MSDSFPRLLKDDRSLLTLLALVLFVLIAAAYSMVTPIGEAPDEPAHFVYAEFVARHHRLPGPGKFEDLSYEGHQPPLDYLFSAAVISGSGIVAVPVFRPDPSFDSHRAGSRGFIDSSSPSARRLFRFVRLAHLLWGVVSLLTVIALVRGFDGREGVAPALAFLFAPQFLFMNAVVNNDAALIAFSSLTLFALVRLIKRPSLGWAFTAGAAASLALFSKGSALFLAVPLGIAALVLARRRLWPDAIVLIGTAVAGLAAWMILNLSRTGVVLPAIPSAGVAGESPLDFVTRPSWIVTMFRSFWAKFGAMNTALPLPFYAWFALLSLLALAGLIAAFRVPGDRAVTLLLFSAIAANLLLVLTFMLRVDWQPQGRYMLPSIGAIAAFGSRGAMALRERWRRGIAVFVPLVSIATALYSAYFIAVAYSNGL